MNRIEIEYKNVLLKGIIIERSAFLVKVQLLSPFNSWINYSMISGRGRGTPNHFLTEQGDKTIEQLLISSYKKYKRLNNTFDRVIKLYMNLQVELESLDEISDIELSKKIKDKLEDWFFDEIFVSSITGINASHNDRKFIFEIIENHFVEKEAIKKWKDYVKNKSYTICLN